MSNTIFIFLLAAFIITSTIKEKEIAKYKYPGTGVTWLQKLAHLISEHFL
jgi:Flp pilus assembly protein protease CpaA